MGQGTEGTKPGLNPGDSLVRCLQRGAGLVTDCVWTPGAKLVFLGLGFLGLGFLGTTQSQVPDTEGASPAVRNLT